MDVQDAARFLVGSSDRLRLLDHLQAEPGTPSDVAAAVDLSHRSVQRTLAALVERGWAEKRGGAYHLTTIGRTVAHEHAAYLDRLGHIAELEPIYRGLPYEVVPLPHVDDATVVVASKTDPQAPLTHYVSRVESLSTDRVRMVSPVLSRLYQEAHAKLVLRGVETELVLDAETVAAARSLNPDEFAFVVSVPRFRLYERPERIRFGLTLADDRALVAAYDDDGQLRALLDGTDDSLLEWARIQWDRHRATARRVR